MLKMLAQVVNATFLDKCGKFQLSRKDEAGPQVFQVGFRLSTDFAVEEGYRHLEVAFWAPQNYVQVLVRETWNVIPLEDLEYNEEEDESFPKPGKDYVEGASAWRLVADHDSGWREGLVRILQEYEKKIRGLDRSEPFWKLIPATSEPFKNV